MSDRYPVPAGRHRVEHVVQRSRFIATAGFAPTVTEARAFLAELRAEFPDATHHVHAFAVGYGASVTHGTSDDGEPAGTAGRPTLTVVQNCGLGDVCVVITRYFGGTKLGTGGLVKAYTEACQLVLESLPRRAKVERVSLRVTVPYAAYETLLRLVTDHEGELVSEDFAGDVTLVASLPNDQIEGFEKRVSDATAGRAEVSREE